MDEHMRERMPAVLWGAVLALSVGPAWAQDAYRCTADVATGFKYNEQTNAWELARFKADSRYVVRKQDSEWIMSEMGADLLPHRCTKAPGSAFIECGGPFMHFITNTGTMRYQNDSVRPNTTLNHPFDKDSVYIEIGRCVPI
jgi:hypothetical protein